MTPNWLFDRAVNEVADMIAAGEQSALRFDALQAKLGLSNEEFELACRAVSYRRLDATAAYKDRLQAQFGELIVSATRTGKAQAEIEVLSASLPWSIDMFVYKTDEFVDWYFRELNILPNEGDSVRDMLVTCACGAAKTSFIERVFELAATAHPEAIA